LPGIRENDTANIGELVFGVSKLPLGEAFAEEEGKGAEE